MFFSCASNSSSSVLSCLTSVDPIDNRFEQLVLFFGRLPVEAPEFDSIVHRSEVMKRIVAKARRVAPREIPVAHSR